MIFLWKPQYTGDFPYLYHICPIFSITLPWFPPCLTTEGVFWPRGMKKTIPAAQSVPRAASRLMDFHVWIGNNSLQQMDTINIEILGQPFIKGIEANSYLVLSCATKGVQVSRDCNESIAHHQAPGISRLQYIPWYFGSLWKAKEYTFTVTVNIERSIFQSSSANFLWIKIQNVPLLPHLFHLPQSSRCWTLDLQDQWGDEHPKRPALAEGPRLDQAGGIPGPGRCGLRRANHGSFGHEKMGGSEDVAWKKWGKTSGKKLIDW